MLPGTLYLTDAGFARWIGDDLFTLFGGGVPEFWASSHAHTTVLVLSLGVYDFVTRRRLHPAWVLGMAWIAVNRVTAIALHEATWWGEFARRIIAAFP
jgi:hypothetical protein